MSSQGRIVIVGLGPGARETMTPMACEAIRQADVVIGYSAYFAWIEGLATGKECIALPLAQETERARLALEKAGAGRNVCVISSGDAGVYGMASLVFELASESNAKRPEIIVVPGISAVNACAALLGAPLAHDFAVISLSDLLTPWEKIERRLIAAAEADFVIALFNPQSQRRNWQFRRAQEIIAGSRAADTPVGIVTNAYRPGQSVRITTVAEMANTPVDMLTTVIVGNSQTREFAGAMVTPRGYLQATSCKEHGECRS
jgi:precorrin-3B C17-methyltransferase